MKQKIAIIIFGLILAIGIYCVLNREPSVSMGSVEIFIENNPTELEAIRIERNFDGKITEYKHPDLDKLIADAKVFNIDADFSSVQEMEIETNMNLVYTGAITGDCFYTYYDKDGKIIKERTNEMKLPVAEVDECVVLIEVKWGKSKNYTLTQYCFVANFNKINTDS